MWETNEASISVHPVLKFGTCLSKSRSGGRVGKRKRDIERGKEEAAGAT